jgi:aspartate aminotransferase
MSTTPGDFLPSKDEALLSARSALTPFAFDMKDSCIRQVAGEVWKLQAEGADVCDFTIGDFSPKQFRVPRHFVEKMNEEALAGQTNYTPSDGLPDLRKAISDFYERELGVDFGADAVVVTGGARPVMFALYTCFLSPDDGLAYGVPSWNNPYYSYLNRARDLPIRTTAASRFLPTADQVRAILPQTRMLILNSPLNPTGTAFEAHELEAICRAVLEENLRREISGVKPVIFVYDHVYWTLTGEGTRHVHPLGLVPELAPWTVYVDAISKSLCGTGIRLGWAVMPPHLKNPIKSLVGHMGGFAPRPAQRATAWYLRQPDLIAADREIMRTAIRSRLASLVTGISALKAEGLPVDFVPPQGGIYLSVRFDLHGRKTPDGQLLSSNDEIRRYLLNRAGAAFIHFQAFGLEDETGWFRASIGSVGVDEIGQVISRLRSALRELEQ